MVENTISNGGADKMEALSRWAEEKGEAEGRRRGAGGGRRKGATGAAVVVEKDRKGRHRGDDCGGGGGGGGARGGGDNGDGDGNGDGNKALNFLRSAWGALEVGRGVREDYDARSPLFASDWTDAWRTTQDLAVVVRAALFMATITFVTTATLGALYDIETDNEIGMTASFASTGITGVIGALAGGQPLVLYGQTGPVQLIYIYLAEYCRNAGGGVTFPGVVAWTGVWAFLMHVVVALLNWCDHRKYITRFAGEIFEMLVASDFITKSFEFLCNAFALKYLLVLDPAFTGGAVFVPEEADPRPGQQGGYVDPTGGSLAASISFISGSGSEWDGVPVRVYTW